MRSDRVQFWFVVGLCIGLILGVHCTPKYEVIKGKEVDRLVPRVVVTEDTTKKKDTADEYLQDQYWWEMEP